MASQGVVQTGIVGLHCQDENLTQHDCFFAISTNSVFAAASPLKIFL